MMKKKYLALLLSIVLTLSLIPTSAFAAMSANIGSGVAAIEISATEPDAEGGIKVTLNVTPGKDKYLTGYTFAIRYNPEMVTPDMDAEGALFTASFGKRTYYGVSLSGITNTANFVTNEFEDSGRSIFLATDANANGFYGEVTPFSVTFYFEQTETAKLVGGMTDFELLTGKAGDTALFEITVYGEDAAINDLSDRVSASLAFPMKSVTLTGGVTEPQKGASDASSVTGTNVKATVSWSPALVDGKFAANTEYTATVTVTPETGYVFADDMTISGLDGYSFAKQSDGSYRASQKFKKTDDKSLTKLDITTPPTKTEYIHGESFDKSGMVVKATYDDNSVDAAFTGYTVDKSVVKFGDTKVILTRGTISAEQSITVKQKELTIKGIQAINREYNGTTAVALTGGTLDGVLAGEKVTAEMPKTGTVADAGMGTGKSVTINKPDLSGADAGSYILADITGVTVDIAAKSAQVVWTTDECYTYTGSELTPPAAKYASVNGEVNCTVISDKTFKNAGKYIFTATTGDTNYTLTNNTTEVTVNKAELVDVTVEQNGTLTYNGVAQAATVTTNATTKGDKLVRFTYSAVEDGTYTAGLPSFTDAGEYTVYYKADAENHETASGSFKVTIAKAAAPTGITGEVTLYHKDSTAGTLSASALTGTPAAGWTDAKFDSVTDMTGDSVLSKQPTVANGVLSYIPTGTAGTGKTSKVTAMVSSRNYLDAQVEISFKTVDISIDWGAIGSNNITLKSAPVYGDKNSNILTVKNASYTARTTVDVPGKLSVKDADSYPNAGATTVTLVFTPDENTGISGTFTHGYTITAVKAKPITVTANAASAVYGADIPAFDFEVPAGALVNNDTKEGLGLTLTTSASKGSNAGVYDITKNAQTTTNYDITVNGTEKFAITAKPMTAGMIQDMASLTYDGTAQTPDVTVKDGDKTLESGTDYTAAYSNNTNAGTAKVVITGKGNYSGSEEKTFTITKKEITVSGIAAVGRAYNGETTVDLDYTNVVFTGKIEGDTLTITATGTMADVNVGTDKNVTISNLTLGGASKDNYALAADGQQTATKVTITKQPATPLSLTAKNAVYTGQPYAQENVTPSRNADEVRLTYYKDNNGAKGDTLNSAPANVGVYWVSGKIEESSNISEALASAVKFQITKAPLTIKANDKTITYGTAPANDGVTYTGLVNNEGAETVVSGLTYAYNYEQYGNVGTYTITPKDATAANYDIKFVSGELTVEQKEVGLTWNNADTLYYDGKAKNVTATATGLESNDAITVTVAGGKQTDIGSYSAAATGLTGAKAGNYKLPAGKTQEYTIEAALTSITVTPSTITATIDGLTIKLVGYKNADADITISAVNATVDGDKLTVNGVEYTIDDSAVVVKSAEVNVKPSETETAKADGADDTITNDVLDEINAGGTKGEGLEKAAAALIESISEGKPEGTSSIEVTFVLKIQPKTYKDSKLTLVIEPYIKRAFMDENGTQIGETQETKISNSELKSLITVSVKLPGGMATTNLFAKHALGNGKFEYLTVTVANGVATWQQSSFSEVTLVSDTRTATITFQKDDGSTITKIYTAANLGEALPTDSRAGHTFSGWTVGGKTYKTLTDEALTAMAALAGGARTLTASFTQNGGGSIGGGGGAATYPVSVDKAENGSVTVSPKSAAKGGTVTIEVKPDEGYELASVTVLDKDGKKLDVTLKNGKYSFVMPDGKVSIKAEFAKKGAMSFADVAANSWYYDAVKYCFDNGLMNGVGEDKFAPSATTTRAMIWTVLARDAGVDTSTGATWYEAGMKWAMENKISDGTGAENAITREQFATMLYRVAQSKGEGFSGSWYFPLSFDDATSISDWADEAMHWCVMKGILNGSNNKLNPTDNASRAEVAAMLMRFLTLDK